REWERASLEIENSYTQVDGSSSEVQKQAHQSDLEQINADAKETSSDAIKEKPTILPATNIYKNSLEKNSTSDQKEIQTVKGEKKSISKRQLIKEIKRVSGNVRTGLILILVGLAISILLGFLLGGLFTSIGAIVIVVGIVFLILGILGV
ncbi:MAG TPA: hypothetical protein VF677_01400, partial [Flavobacterium sp.]